MPDDKPTAEPQTRKARRRARRCNEGRTERAVSFRDLAVCGLFSAVSSPTRYSTPLTSAAVAVPRQFLTPLLVSP